MHSLMTTRQGTSGSAGTRNTPIHITACSIGRDLGQLAVELRRDQLVHELGVVVMQPCKSASCAASALESLTGRG